MRILRKKRKNLIIREQIKKIIYYWVITYIIYMVDHIVVLPFDYQCIRIGILVIICAGHLQRKFEPILRGYWAGRGLIVSLLVIPYGGPHSVWMHCQNFSHEVQQL